VRAVWTVRAAARLLLRAAGDSFFWVAFQCAACPTIPPCAAERCTVLCSPFSASNGGTGRLLFCGAAREPHMASSSSTSPSLRCAARGANRGCALREGCGTLWLLLARCAARLALLPELMGSCWTFRVAGLPAATHHPGAAWLLSLSAAAGRLPDTRVCFCAPLSLWTVLPCFMVLSLTVLPLLHSQLGFCLLFLLLLSLRCRWLWFTLYASVVAVPCRCGSFWATPLAGAAASACHTF